MRKYELTDETKTIEDGTVLHRIRAVRDFTLVNGDKIWAGKLGGWIENESNLSHDGKAWVYGEAQVFEAARVAADAAVGESATVCGHAHIGGYACVTGSARVHCHARIYGSVHVFGCAYVCGDAVVGGNALVHGSAYVGGHAKVYGSAVVKGDAKVLENAIIYGSACVYGAAEIAGIARVSCANDYVVFKNAWGSGRFFTYTRSDGMWKVGCFHGTGKELIDKAYKDSELSGKCYERIVRAQEAIDREIHKGCRK